jgi:large subunit ribosomal protein L21
MYAIVETGGKQYRVQPGDIVRVESICGEPGSAVSLDRVLLVSDDTTVSTGTPYVRGAAVTAEIVQHGRGDKIIVFKFKSKKNVRKKQGHRQNFTDIKIQGISLS